MSTAIARNFQIGIDPTPTNNFTLYQPATPDGTLRLGNGNTGITSSLLTLTSAGNLGIGTTSPGYRLDVNGIINGNNSIISRRASGSQPEFVLTQTGVASWSIYNPPSSTDLRFYNGSDLLTMTSAGNLGLGVTPSAWTGSFKALQIGAQGGLSATSTGTFLSANWYTDGTNRYIGSGNATLYQQLNGQHAFYTAGSGTAGNAISFTQAMTLDASGNLLLGTTSGNGLKLDFSPTSSQQNGITYVNSSPNSYTDIYGCGTSGSWQGAIRFFTSNNAAASERARIDSSGNLLVGVTSNTGGGRIDAVSNTSFSVIQARSTSTGSGDGTTDVTVTRAVSNGGNAWANAKYDAFSHRWGFGGSASATEAMRIDSSGNLLVGTTSGSTNIFKNNRSNDQVAYFQNDNTSNPFGLYINYTSAAPNGTGAWFISCRDSGTNRMQVYSNGGIANFSGNNVNLSDRREKTNFAPAGEYLSKICAIPVQTFNYIDQNMEEDPGTTLGVVAQDVQAVAPELVLESNWGTQDDPKMRLSVYQTDLQYALMKALQELKAEFDAYKATHP